MSPVSRSAIQYESIEERLARGEWIGLEPIGYMRYAISDDPRENRPIVINPQTAPVIQELFEMATQPKASVLHLWKNINKKYPWFKISRSYVYTTLKNPFYYGIMRVKGIDYPHYYPTLIRKELYDAVQQNLQKERTSKPQKETFWYKKTFTCTACNTLITYEMQKTYRMYRCTNYNKQHKNAYVQEHVITSAVLDNVSYLPNAQQLKELFNQLPHDKKAHFVSGVYKTRSITPHKQIVLQAHELFIQDPHYAYKELYNMLHKKTKVVTQKQAPSMTISASSTLHERIKVYAQQLISTDELLEKTNAEPIELQSALFDLQINNELEEVSPGQWRAR